MGSSRRFGTSSELKLQKVLRQHDTRIDASQIATPTTGDRLTRFDFEATRGDEKLRKEIDEKREVCFNKIIEYIK
jgi:hypothetical protein